MKALIFAAGLGTRLKPLTDTTPKALISVGGIPLLEHIIHKLKSAGVNEIIINIHHFANQIIDFVQQKNSFDIRIEFSDETGLLLDTGGGIKKAAWFFDDEKPFFVHNVDILSNIDLGMMYNAHIREKALATLFVSQRETNRYLLFNENNRLSGWINVQSGEIKPATMDIDRLQKLAFNGIHILSPGIFAKMDDFTGKFSIIDFYLSIINDNNIQAFVFPEAQIMDIGKIESVHEAEGFLLKLSR